MCVVPGEEAARLGLVSPLSGESVQPAGIDLRVAEVYLLRGMGSLSGDRIIPAGSPVLPVRGAWRLGPGAYRIRFLEAVRVPLWAAGFCFPRSSLLRSGVALHCAVWDPGYEGRGEALLTVYNPYGFSLGVGERVAQIVFHRLCEPAREGYRGAYQGEGLAEEP